MKRTLVVHPFLLALFFVLFVYTQYREHMLLSQIWTSVLILLGFTAIVLLPFTLVLRDAKRAGMLVSLFLLLFFSFGVVHRALFQGRPDVPASGNQILLITWVVMHLWVRGENPNLAVAPLPPVLFNAFGVALYLAPIMEVNYWFAVQMIGVGQLIACYLIGLPLLLLLEKRRHLFV